MLSGSEKSSWNENSENYSTRENIIEITDEENHGISNLHVFICEINLHTKKLKQLKEASSKQYKNLLRFLFSYQLDAC